MYWQKGGGMYDVISELPLAECILPAAYLINPLNSIHGKRLGACFRVLTLTTGVILF